MTQLHVVPPSPVGEENFILKAIPFLRSVGSGHMGIALSDIDPLFKEQFGREPIETLNKMIQTGIIIAALLKWSKPSGRRSSRLKSAEILEKLPTVVNRGFHLRIYLSVELPTDIRKAQAKRAKHRQLLEEILK